MISKFIRHGFLISLTLFSVSFLLFPVLPLLAQEEKKESLTIGELTQTKASELFVTRQFAEALEEFRKLEREYPKDVVIKRYIGACLDHLGRDEEAIEAFRKVLKLNPKDLPSRQFLAKIYVRKGNLDQAEEELTFLIDNDPQGTFAPGARGELESIKKLRETEKKTLEAPGRAISSGDFLETKAAKAFMNAKYKEALQELLVLEKKHPGDILIKRYQGMALDKLGRYDEAILAFQSGLSIDPENIPLHYYLAQTHLHKTDYDGAKREFEYVVAHDESRAYQARAKAELDALEQLLERLKRAQPKKWSLNASAGFDWVSNPNSVTRRDSLRTTLQDSTFKFSNSVGGSYELFKKGAWSTKATYSYSQTLYGDSIRQLNTYGNSWGVTATYIRPLAGKPLITQFGHTTSHTIVNVRFYSASFAESVTAIYSPLDWYRISVSEKWSYNPYDSDGTNPDSTSRDGFSNVWGITNTLYANREKTIYYTLGFEHTHDRTQGINYRKDAFLGNVALHFPLMAKFAGDLSFKIKDSQYPKYGHPPPHIGRRDQEYTLGANLSRPIGQQWTLRGGYTYLNSHSRDDNFTYSNHTLGLSLSYNY